MGVFILINNDFFLPDYKNHTITYTSVTILFYDFFNVLTQRYNPPLSNPLIKQGLFMSLYQVFSSEGQYVKDPGDQVLSNKSEIANSDEVDEAELVLLEHFYGLHRYCAS